MGIYLYLESQLILFDHTGPDLLSCNLISELLRNRHVTDPVFEIQ